ncbi:MAG: CPBP family intramembrane glutamic endopeptidase [Eubacteriales bacterium]|jgi:membrane protease YdiL (CAAX protease family)
MNNKTKDLKTVAFAAAGMFLAYWIYSIFIENYLPVNVDIKTLIGKAILFIFGVGIFLISTKNIENYKYSKNKASAKTILICFLLQFTALMATIIISFLGTALITAFGGKYSAPDDTMSPVTLILLLVLNPVVEEIVFRHLFANKLLKHGERLYIFMSAYCFAIAHGVSLGVIQIGYTFILGMIYSYLMVKTGNLVLVVILHSLSNLFGGVLLKTLSNVSIGLAALYLLSVVVLGVIGLTLFLLNRKNIVLDGNEGLVDIQTIKELVTNKGVIIYSAITFVMIILRYIFN